MSCANRPCLPHIHDDCLKEGFVMADALVLQLREKVLLRQQGSYILTVEAGRQLLLSADSRAEAALQDELLNIQERWRHANICLEEQKKELAVLLRVDKALYVTATPVDFICSHYCLDHFSDFFFLLKRFSQILLS